MRGGTNERECCQTTTEQQTVLVKYVYMYTNQSAISVNDNIYLKQCCIIIIQALQFIKSIEVFQSVK